MSTQSISSLSSANIYPRALTEHQAVISVIVYMWKSRVNSISVGQEESQSWVRMDGEQTVLRRMASVLHRTSRSILLPSSVGSTLLMLSPCQRRKEGRKTPPSSVGSKLPNPVILTQYISNFKALVWARQPYFNCFCFCYFKALADSTDEDISVQTHQVGRHSELSVSIRNFSKIQISMFCSHLSCYLVKNRILELKGSKLIFRFKNNLINLVSFCYFTKI